MKKIISLLVIFVLIPVIVFAQNNNVKTEKINLKGNHVIGLNLGLSNQTTNVTVDINNVSTDMNFQASLSYNYWFTNELAIEANAGYLASSVNSNVTIFNVEQKTAVIAPYYLGAKYSPEALSISDNIRPFVSFLVGGVTGSGTEEKVTLLNVTTEVYTESVFSMKSGIGADALVSKLIKLGLSVDYMYMPDFKRTVGTRKNYSGVNVSFGLGFML
ncbi:MAG: outer membrane beta-barrel protein [Ignavibacteria bacterium]|nr:outer membrane beta-barrel protein [Ignavibacteria bacterium]